MLLCKSNLAILLFSLVLYINGNHSFKIESEPNKNTEPPASLVDKTNEQTIVLNNEQKQQLELLQQRRPELKEFVEALLSNLENKNDEIEDSEDLNELSLLEEPESHVSAEISDQDTNNDDFFFSSKRSTNRFKKEFEEKRNKNLRRQQAAKWDIGFGKRGVQLPASFHIKPKSFLDALYGKRSAKNNKVTFGRKQQWDIRYGK